MATKTKFDSSKYNSSIIGMHGVNSMFYLCHLPFITYKDVFGALALEGSSGTGKTTIVKRLGLLNQKVTNGRVGIFSADKAKYEDFVGIPIPDETTGTMKIYSMPHAVADMETVLIDEINRASVENQEKWLSLIATRLIDSLPTKCKFIFAAMNPVLSENQHDVYEGVIPLDKSLGERMVGVVKFPHYNKMPSADRISVLRAAFGQVNWEPTEQAAEEFSSFLEASRCLYEQSKEEVAESVFRYVDAVQSDLAHHTKGAVSIEARRAQYITFNILALHSINTVLGIAGLEVSAQQALMMSFPNSLWDQEINLHALKAAHDKSSTILHTQSKSKVNPQDTSFIEQALDDLLLAVKSKTTKEEFSSLVNQNLPVKENNIIDHYCYALGIYLGLNNAGKGGEQKQTILKEQEFKRMESIANEIIKHKRTKELEKLNQSIKSNNNIILDASKSLLPSFIRDEFDADAKEVFKVAINFNIGCYAAVLGELYDDAINAAGHQIIIKKIAKIANVFREISKTYAGEL